MSYVKNFARRGLARIREGIASRRGSAAYWTTHMVANETFADATASLEHYLWRNAQYPGYIDLMPVNNADNLVVLDYGCGPGNDLIGFCEYSKLKKLYGVDVSSTALRASEQRLRLHGKTAELILIDEIENVIPVDSESVDLVHTSGVLHHVRHIEAAVQEIHRVLRKGGKMQVMVYNYNSIWLHLYTAYIHQIKKGLYSDVSLLDAFRRTTDGPHCPISHCYKPDDFLSKVKRIGFEGHFCGAAISMTEMRILPERIDAINNRNLSREHRDFLSSLKFNEYGHPTYNGAVAGIDACYAFTKL